MSSLRQYRLFVTLLVIPIVAIVLIVVLIVTLFGGGDEEPVAASLAPTAGVVAPVPSTPTLPPPRPSPTVAVQPTQTPLPEPTPGPTATPEPTPTPPTPTPAPTGPIEYEVQPEDTLFSIATQFGVSVDEMVEFNELPDAEFIFVGQILEVPTDPSQIVERRESRPEPVSAVIIPAEGLNVRDAPSTADGTVQYVAPGGSQVELTGIKQEIDGIEWWEIDDGNWTQGQYLEIGAEAAPTPVPEATTAPEATPAATAAPPGDSIKATVVPAAGLNVRSTPAPDAPVSYVAPGGSELELTGETQVIDGVTWWRIVDGAWVQGQFLKFG